MDSLSQIALGAAVGTAVLGRRVGAKAAVWGAVCGTLPDLDVLISHGDPVRDFTFHRAESHALFWLTVAAPALAWLVWRMHRSAAAGYRHWLLLVWAALVTHPLLDAFTVYGTQIFLPFSDYPVGLGSIFIIDPLYTVPLVAGVIIALALRRHSAQKAAWANAAGLALSTLYLGWTVAAQAHVEGVVHRTLGTSGLADGRILVTPTPFNTLLWRVVTMDDDGYHEGFYSLLDERPEIAFQYHPSANAALEGLRDDWTVQRLAWFSKGFYAVALQQAEAAPPAASSLLLPDARAAASAHVGPGTPVVMSDLRMGQTPWFAFSFIVGRATERGVAAVPAAQLPSHRPPAEALGWLWRRIHDEHAGPPLATGQNVDILD